VNDPNPDPKPAIPRAVMAARIIEAFVLFALIPGLLASRLVRVPLLPMLWAASAYCFWRLRLDAGFNLRSLCEARAAPGEWRRMLLTFTLVAGLLTTLVGWRSPGLLFSFPLRRPWNWALLLGLYPPLSVFPQEVIYRAFFFNRYQFLFGNGKWLLLGSSFAFGITHLAFHNWIAVALTPNRPVAFGNRPVRQRGGGADYLLVSRWVSRAIISSSLVGTIATATVDSGVEMSLSSLLRLPLISSSIFTPRKDRRLQTQERSMGEFSPMPAVKVMASTPFMAAA
jgi:hypothetical protein